MANSPTSSECGFYEYEPPVALWALVEKDVPPHERQEIRKMLGESLVEQSLELHEEVNTLLEIWREYREETEQIFTKNRLPEPPAARERLKQEIKFFVESIREKAKEKGSDADDILGKHKTEVIDYALDTERAPSSGYYSRPTSARSSRDGRETPLRLGTPLPDRDSNVSSRSEEVEAINDKLTYLKFDEVVQHLRETLEDEVAQLTRDTEFLQGCLDDEADFRCLTGPNREPTLTELREERSLLEKDLLKSVPDVPKVLQHTKKTSPPLKTMHSGISPGSLQRVRVTSSNTSTPTNSGKIKPLKASHQISPESNNQVKAQRITSAEMRNGPESRKLSLQGSQKSPSNIQPGLGGKGVLVESSNLKANKSPVSSASKDRHLSKNQIIDSDLFDAQPQHIVVRTNTHTNSSQSVVVPSQTHSVHGNVVPSPPSSAKPSRPGSAHKFRRMVMECRD